MKTIVPAILAFSLLFAPGRGLGQEPTDAQGNPYAGWERGPNKDASFFPIAVWLQNPSRAGEYKKAGFNTYVGLWRGPTEEQLAQLSDAGMHVICDQNEVALRNLENPVITGWMHGDEPDNAQPLGGGRGYGPPIEPAKIIEDYRAIKKKDPSRPVLLNLGQGVAWDQWYGRGVRTNHPEDYREYVKGCDIASFDIYPVVHDHPDVQGNLWYVARGVERLKEWTAPRQIVWNCIECTRIQSPDRKPTPEQVRSEVWMALIHGSMGLIYFVHEWEPAFDEAALLHDPVMLEAVTDLNRQIGELAPVLNSPTIKNPIGLQPEPADMPIAVMAKEHQDVFYLFTAEMRGKTGTTAFSAPAGMGNGMVEVLGENRKISVSGGAFTDRFEPYDVHIYIIRPQ